MTCPRFPLRLAPGSHVNLGLCLLACCLTCGLASAELPTGWSEFHGPATQGYSAGSIPAAWTDSDYVWRRKLGSRDVGSPIVVGESVYYLVSKPASQQIALESINVANGQLRWSREFDQAKHHLHARNTNASSTPAADDRNVFICWSDPDHTYLKCFDHEGNEIWSRDFGRWVSQHGFGTSPRIVGSLVLLFNSQQAEQLGAGVKPGDSRMIAVDRNSGETVWETSLNATRSCYGVPAIHQAADGSTQIIDANTGNGLFALDAQTGKMLWNLEVFDMRCCSSPLVVGDIAIGSSGSGGGGNHLVAVRMPQTAGEKPQELYRIDREKKAPYVPTPALLGNRMFMVSDSGTASCVDVQTGEALWSERIDGNFGASPVVIGDKLLLISLSGQATILKADDTFELLGEVDLGGPVGATPAYDGGRLLLRVDDELRCLANQS